MTNTQIVESILYKTGGVKMGNKKEENITDKTKERISPAKRQEMLKLKLKA